MANEIKFTAVIDKALEWSIYLTLFAIPFSKSIIEICISIGIVLLIIKKIITRNFKMPSTPADMPLLFIFATAMLSLVNSQYIGLSLRALLSKNLKFIALYFLIVETIDSREKMNNLLKMGLLSALAVFIDALIQYFITHTDLLHNYPPFKFRFEDYDDGRFFTYSRGYPTGPFPFPNDLAAWLLIIIPTALFVSLFDLKNRIFKYQLLFFSVIGFYIFVLSKVRSAWAGFIVSLASLIFFLKKVVAIILIIAIVLISVCFIKSPYLVFGFSSMQDRTVMWSTAMKIFKEHPIIGNGINTFFNKYKYMREDRWKGEKGSYAHNCYLQMMADLGILGLAAFLWFIITVIGSALANLRIIKDRFYYSLTLGLTSGIIAFLFHSFFDTNLYSLNLTTLFWISAGLLSALTVIARSKTTT